MKFLTNAKKELKKVKEKLEKIVSNTVFKISLIGVTLTSPLWAPLSYLGDLHCRDPPAQENVNVKVWSSNPGQSTINTTTTPDGRWSASLDQSNPGDTVYATYRKLYNGKILKGKLKDIGDGKGEIPDLWLYDSLTVANYPDSIIRTFNIYELIDTSGYYVYAPAPPPINKCDTTLKVYGFIKGKGNIIQDTMIIDNNQGYEFNLSKMLEWRGDTWALDPHLYRVYYPLKGLQPFDTFNIVIFKNQPIKVVVNNDSLQIATKRYETKLENLVYDTTDFGYNGTQQIGHYFGDAYVWYENGGPYWYGNYDTLYFPSTIDTIDDKAPYIAILDTIPDQNNTQGPFPTRTEITDQSNPTYNSNKLYYYVRKDGSTTEIDSVNGSLVSSGTTKTDTFAYNFSINTALPCSVYYYVKAIDTSGNVGYSDTLGFEITEMSGEETQPPGFKKKIKISKIEKIAKYSNINREVEIIFPGTEGWISVYDVLGRKIKRQRAKPGKNKIDLKRPGIYFIKVDGFKREVYWVPKE